MKISKNNAVLSTAMGAFLLPLASHAQTQSTEATIERISVVGARSAIQLNQLSATSYVLEASDIQASGLPYLADLLRTLPSVSLSQSGGIGGLSEVRIRGAESNHLVVMIDGVVVNDESQGGFVDFAHITTDNIIRIELLQGSQSALWGSGAVAGVLSITTRNSQGNKPYLNASVGNQSYTNVGAGITGGTDDLRWNLDVQHLDTDGQNVSRQGDEDDGYANSQLLAGLSWQADEQQSVSVSFRAVDYENDFDGTDFVNTGLPTDADNVTDGVQFSGKLDWQYQATGSDVQHNLSVQVSDNQSENFSQSISTGETESQKWRNVYWAAIGLDDKGSVNIGAEWVRETFTQRGPVGFGDPNQDQSYTAKSVFSDVLYDFTDALSFTASARFDSNSDFDNDVSYRVGPRYRLNDHWSIYASVGQAVRNPTFTERYGFFPDSFIGNPELQPEQSRSVEWGVDYFDNDLSFQVAGFDTTLENEINGFVFSPDAGQFTAQNSDAESDRRGFEVSVAKTWTNVSLRGHYAYLDANEGSDTETPIAELRRPQDSGSITLGYSPVDSALSANVSASYVGERDDIFFPPFPAPSERVTLDSYWIVNAAVQYRWLDSATIQLSATNLFDEDYEDIVGFVGRARQVRLGLRYAF